MSNNYLKFITDKHLISCIENLYKAYLRAKSNVNKQKLYKNKIDTIKLTFDAKFNGLDEETLINSEITRQIDKSINNAIGTFHEEILGGIDGYEKGALDGYDIKASDNTLFADIKNKYNTVNSSSAESLYQKLQKFANEYPTSKCYWVQIWARKSFCQNWKGKINGKEYAHNRVFAISGDQFYYLLSGRRNALYELYEILPSAIDDFLRSGVSSQSVAKDSALDEISKSAESSSRSILDQITLDNFGYYLGFDKLK